LFPEGVSFAVETFKAPDGSSFKCAWSATSAIQSFAPAASSVFALVRARRGSDLGRIPVTQPRSVRIKIVTIARIYIKEGDKIESHNLMEEIFKLLHDEHKVHSVTVFRGVAEFGTRGGEVHADDLLRMIVHLPLMLEFYDDPEVVAPLLSRIQQMVPGGHIVSWTARCDSSS
jgi:uncharacterized protein